MLYFRNCLDHQCVFDSATHFMLNASQTPVIGHVVRADQLVELHLDGPGSCNSVERSQYKHLCIDAPEFCISSIHQGTKQHART